MSLGSVRLSLIPLSGEKGHRLVKQEKEVFELRVLRVVQIVWGNRVSAQNTGDRSQKRKKKMTENAGERGGQKLEMILIGVELFIITMCLCIISVRRNKRVNLT